MSNLSGAGAAMMNEPKSVENDDDVIRIEEANSSCIENTDRTPQIVIGGSRSAFQRWIPDDSSSSSGSDSSYSSSSSSNKSVNTSDTDQDGNAALPVCNIVDTGMDPSNNNISSLEAISSILIADTQVEVIDENDDDVIEGTPLKNNNLGCICHFECQVNRMVLFTALLCGGMIIAYLSMWIYAFMHDVDDTEIYGPKPNNKVESEALVFLRDQVLSNISNMSHLLNQESSQYQAMQWLSDEDKIINNRTVIHSTEILSEQEYGMIVDRYVMALFYYSTNGPEWYDPGNFLNTKKHICDWGTITLNEAVFSTSNTEGNIIGCDESGNIEAMIFRVNNLEGQIPMELSKYNASLNRLDLDGNGLHGSIPSSFECMSKLKHLRLYANRLTGRLPYLGNMIHMEEFTVAINKLQGSITDLGFEKMTSLRNLQLSNNQFSGTIPQSLSALELQSLKVEGNNFTGNMTGICNSSFVPGIFYADCVEKVQCSCCTGCW